MLVDLAAFILGWCAGWWLLWEVPVPRGERAGRAGPAASIVVPARDEERNVVILLASLLPQVGPGDEVLVVDDHSGDATAEVARQAGAHVLAAPPLPPGWQGKAWACHTGAGAATGELLIFLDADTRLEPGGLERLRQAARSAGGLYSVQPWHEVPRASERLAALFNLVAMMGTGAFTPLGRRARAVGAFGPCLATSAADYRALGGHASVRDAILDDLALAERYRAAGLPVTIRGGRGTIAVRLYPEGLGQLVEGFTKNFAAAARAVRPPVLVLVVAWLAALNAPLVLVADAPGLAAACYLAAAVQLGILLRRLGTFGAATAALYLVPLAVFVAVFARSLVVTFVRGQVRWKGRDLPTRRPPRSPPA
ncbi:MAG: glycosyltransferase [Actinomycetota bacterium]|nr:glycosyltransferase [Actinomycetota bacterium]